MCIHLGLGDLGLFISSKYQNCLVKLESQEWKIVLEPFSTGQNCLVKCLLTKFLLTKNPVLNTSMVTLKSSLQSEIIYLCIYLSIFLSSFMPVIRHKKQTEIYIYYFFLKPYRKKKSLTLPIFPSKINNFFLCSYFFYLTYATFF